MDDEIQGLFDRLEREAADAHEFDHLFKRFGGFDPSQPRAADGRWDPSGGGGGGDKKKDKPEGKREKKAEEDKPMSESERRTRLVRAILKALDDVLDQLTSKQARALIDRIKDNAKAFIDGQQSSGPGNRGGGGGKKSGGGKEGGADAKGGKGGKGDDADGKGGGRPGGLEGVIAGVKNLIENFGRNMKPKDRKALQDAVDKLDSMAADVATFASDVKKTVCVMAITADIDPVHGIGPNDKHATVLYFGDYDAHEDPEAMEGGRELLREAVETVALHHEPFTARVIGVEPLGSDEPQARVWMLDSPELQVLFQDLRDVDGEVQDLYMGADATRYPEYKPHVTIGYGDEGDVSEARQVEDILFDRLSLWWGDEHHDVPLGAAEFDALLTLFDIDLSEQR